MRRPAGVTKSNAENVVVGGGGGGVGTSAESSSNCDMICSIIMM